MVMFQSTTSNYRGAFSHQFLSLDLLSLGYQAGSNNEQCDYRTIEPNSIFY